MFSSNLISYDANMVAISPGQKQLTGASKDEFSKWKSKLRVLLNRLRVLDTDSGDKVRASLGIRHLPENFGKPRGKVTDDLLNSEQGPSLRAAGFQVGDTLITGQGITKSREIYCDFIHSPSGKTRIPSLFGSLGSFTQKQGPQHSHRSGGNLNTTLLAWPPVCRLWSRNRGNTRH